MELPAHLADASSRFSAPEKGLVAAAPVFLQAEPPVLALLCPEGIWGRRKETQGRIFQTPPRVFRGDSKAPSKVACGGQRGQEGAGQSKGLFWVAPKRLGRGEETPPWALRSKCCIETGPAAGEKLGGGGSLPEGLLLGALAGCDS